VFESAYSRFTEPDGGGGIEQISAPPLQSGEIPVRQS
jgi:hypothetical protein